MKVSINKIQKITVGKSDEVALVVEKIIDADAKELVINIPRFSKLADSSANFHLIKREAKLLDKKIIIESVDDKVIELAGVAGLESLNPILPRSGRQFSDIVSSKRPKEEIEEAVIKKKKLAQSVKQKPPKSQPPPRPRIKLRKLIWILPASAALSGAAFFIFSVLPRAEIKITTVKIPWNYNDSVRAEKLAAIDSATATIPAQVFNQKATLQLSFPTTGKKYVEQKASGKLIIYNAYSSDPQPLVVNTRFISPDGKIFRLTKGIIVPGAKIIEGKITPSTFEASVVADKPGSEYNIGPVSYFSIPGFQGTPKYQAFYAESKEPMAGGFVGEVAFPTTEDLKKAKAEIAEKLEKALKQRILTQIPTDFKIIDGAIGFNLIKQDVTPGTDDNGNFRILSEGAMSIVTFKEIDLLAMLEAKIKKEKGEGYEIKKSELSYEKARADFTAGRISFPIKFASTLARHIDVNALRKEVKGKSEQDLKSMIYALPELQSAVVSLWPFWVKSVPQNESKITILVD